MPRHAKRLIAALIAACGMTMGSGTMAQPTVRIDTIASQQTCTYYQNSEGAAAGSASAGWFGASASVAVAWRTWWVKDCVSNFATMKSSLEAALASSGKLAITSRSANYALSGIVSADGTQQDSMSQQTSRGGDIDIDSTGLFATMDITLKDASGKTIYGANVRKRIDLGNDATADGVSTGSEQSGQAIYNQLQEALALAVARKVAFHLVPLTVIGGDGRTIRLNYGAPYLQLGTTVEATSPDGRVTIRYNVVAADDAAATAEVDGDGNAGLIVPGSTATVIEADDPAANGRRMKRVDLP